MDRTIDVERLTWTNVCAAVTRADRAEPRAAGGRRPKFGDRLVVLMFLWAAWHGRSLSWACDRRHYGRLFRPRKLPSVSRFGRRVRTARVAALLQRVHDALGEAGLPLFTGYVDGKPLTVGAVSKDPDARVGKVTGGYARGYKLHAVVNKRRRVVVWSVTPLNVGEQTVALALAAHLPRAVASDEVILGDGNYDSAPLHKALNPTGRALLTPPKGQGQVRPGGHHEVTLRQMGPGRREMLDAWAACPALAEQLLRDRNNVEGTFSVLATALDLHLPAFVRRLGRVTRWVGAKIILYHARLLAQEMAGT
jgi:hypothetical protein